MLYPSNPLANYMSILNCFITSGSSYQGWHSINADTFCNCQLAATLGALLPKVCLKLFYTYGK